MLQPKGLTESQFFQGAVVRFREQKVDENDLECDPAGVCDEIFPSDCSKGDRIHKCGEEVGSSPKELKESDSPGTLRVREQLDEIGCKLLVLLHAIDLSRVT